MSVATARRPPVTLDDFAGGEVLAVIRPDLMRDAATLEQIRRWLADGLLTTPDDQPDAALSLFYSNRLNDVRPLPADYRPFQGPGSWPWHCGRFARWADERHKTKTVCPLVGETAARWMAGYNGHSETSLMKGVAQ